MPFERYRSSGQHREQVSLPVGHPPVQQQEQRHPPAGAALHGDDAAGGGGGCVRVAAEAGRLPCQRRRRRRSHQPDSDAGLQLLSKPPFSTRVCSWRREDTCQTRVILQCAQRQAQRSLEYVSAADMTKGSMCWSQPCCALEQRRAQWDLDPQPLQQPCIDAGVADNQCSHWACQQPFSLDSKHSQVSQLLVHLRLASNKHCTTSHEMRNHLLIRVCMHTIMISS